MSITLAVLWSRDEEGIEFGIWCKVMNEWFKGDPVASLSSTRMSELAWYNRVLGAKLTCCFRITALL